MHVLALMLAFAAAASPALAGSLSPSASPAPSAQPASALKVIGNVRSTPFCTALRERIGPAIAGVLANDELIGSSRPAFRQLYHDDVLARSSARAHFDMYRLEKLITPIVTNIKTIDSMLDRKQDDRRLQAMREKLQAVAAHQKESLNVISGVVATEQLGELQGESFPDNWASAFSASASQPANRPAPASQPAPAASNLLSAGVHGEKYDPHSRDPSYSPDSVGPTYDPFGQFVRQIEDERAAAQNAETEAAKLVSDAVLQCAP